MAVFSYYARLSKANKAIYRASDRAPVVQLTNPAAARPHVMTLKEALKAENRSEVTASCRALLDCLNTDLAMPRVTLQVFAVRPSHDWGELYGEYEQRDGQKAARISVWMRTARHRRMVAFKTFLRTLLHEYCHHLDYEYLGLADSFHTEAFFKRESALFKQLLPD